MSIHLLRAGWRRAHPHLPFRAGSAARRSLPERLCAGPGRWPARPRGDDGGDAGECVHNRPRNGSGRANISNPLPFSALAPRQRRDRRNGCPPHSRGLGLSRRRRPPPCTTALPGATAASVTRFGYGACPNMDDQQGIWKLLRPEEIGVHLTEGMMMEPESQRQRPGIPASRLRLFHGR